MADNQSESDESLGKYARHPIRTAGTAFLIGTVVGAGIMATKIKQEKSPVQKIMDQIGL